MAISNYDKVKNKDYHLKFGSRSIFVISTLAAIILWRRAYTGIELNDIEATLALIVTPVVSLSAYAAGVIRKSNQLRSNNIPYKKMIFDNKLEDLVAMYTDKTEKRTKLLAKDFSIYNDNEASHLQDTFENEISRLEKAKFYLEFLEKRVKEKHFGTDDDQMLYSLEPIDVTKINDELYNGHKLIKKLTNQEATNN